MKLWRFALLASMCFGFQAALLAYLPLAATRAGLGTFVVGFAVAVYVGIGIVFDSMIGKIVARIGVRATILSGIALAAISLAFLAGPIGDVTLVTAAILAGSAHAFQSSPILSSLSLVITGSQVRGQCINVMAQRGGALIASFSLLLMGTSTADLRRVLWILLAWLVVFCFTATTMGKSPRKRALQARLDAPHDGHGIIKTLVGAASVRAGVSASLSTGLVVIFGASFVPLLLVKTGRPELIVFCLVGREAFALIGAMLLWATKSRKYIARSWYVASLVGVVGAISGIFAGPEWLVALGLTLNGLSLSQGIILGNVQIHDGTTENTRIYGYAAQSIISRMSGWTSPIILSAALIVSLPMLLTTFSICSASAVGIHVALNRRSSAPEP